MARKIIIHNANFSQNGIYNTGQDVYVPLFGLDTAALTKATTTTANKYFPSPVYQSALLKGKTIYGVIVRTVSSGKFNVLMLKGYSTTNPEQNQYNFGTIRNIQTFTGVAGQVMRHYFDEPITIDDDYTSFGYQPNGSAIYTLDTTPPGLYYIQNVANDIAKWTYNPNYGGGIDLLVKSE